MFGTYLKVNDTKCGICCRIFLLPLHRKTRQLWFLAYKELKTMRRNLLLPTLLLLSATLFAQSASVRIDANTKHQHITGFGAFVCSPQFAYNHMSTTEIKRVWGPTSTIGCNIMRLYIPIGRNSWNQSLATAKSAKQMGLIVFASPWGQPAEWKTNNSTSAKNDKGELGSLKKENWGDYAKYLDDYVKYMRENGVELDAISIQNEPDMNATYAGCMWTPQEIANFVKTYGKTISCKVMAPESMGSTDNYASVLNNTDVLSGFDIYGGHQYAGIGSSYKNLAAKGKELWMTEFLINWNEGKADPDKRNYDFSKDFFDFFRAINICMLGDFNAWIHYAAKRYYALLGDGTTGAGGNGVVTKRGYIMAHFAKFVTGMTRIDAIFSSSDFEGSAYLSQTGDTVVAVMANTSDKAQDLMLDLPFYTQQGELYTTGKSNNFTKKVQTPATETCRPVAAIPAQSVATVLYVKSRERQVSNMKGDVSYFDRVNIDDLTTSKSGFGTAYKLSGKTKTFNHSNPLISSNTDASKGYVQLDGNYSKLVFEVKKLSSNMNYSSAITTLVYVNSQGKVASHNYGDLVFNVRENFQWVFDISPATLTDGCKGIISMTNNNWSSNLSFTFGDVYLSGGNSEYMGSLSGDYVADDSHVLDFSTDPFCTSVDMTTVTGLPESLPWLEGTNRVVYVGEDCQLKGSNVVKGNVCPLLVINEAAGPFHPEKSFTATNASYTCEVNGSHIVQLPFQSTVPEGVVVYTLTSDLQPEIVSGIVPANQPLLVEAQGDVTFVGSGEVAYSPCKLTDDVLPIATPTAVRGIPSSTLCTPSPVYNFKGQRVDDSHRGLIISNGKIYLNKK